MRAFCDTIFEIILEDADWTRGSPKYIIIVLDMLFDLDKHKFIFLFCDEKPRKESDRELFYIRLLILRL